MTPDTQLFLIREITQTPRPPEERLEHLIKLTEFVRRERDRLHDAMHPRQDPIANFFRPRENPDCKLCQARGLNA